MKKTIIKDYVIIILIIVTFVLGLSNRIDNNINREANIKIQREVNIFEEEIKNLKEKNIIRIERDYEDNNISCFEMGGTYIDDNKCYYKRYDPKTGGFYGEFIYEFNYIFK